MEMRSETRYADGTMVYGYDLSKTTSERLAARCRELGLEASVEAKAESRRREVLGERLLLWNALAAKGLGHNADRAPLVPDVAGYVSIAHTRSTLLLAINTRHPIGIDLEGYRERVLRVRDAFLNEGERQWLAATDLMCHVVAWTAKEAVFKAISRRELVSNYRDQIVLLPFAAPMKGATLSHSATFGERRFTLTTVAGDDEVFTLAVEQNDNI